MEIKDPHKNSNQSSRDSLRNNEGGVHVQFEKDVRPTQHYDVSRLRVHEDSFGGTGTRGRNAHAPHKRSAQPHQRVRSQRRQQPQTRQQFLQPKKRSFHLPIVALALVMLALVVFGGFSLVSALSNNAASSESSSGVVQSEQGTPNDENEQTKQEGQPTPEGDLVVGGKLDGSYETVDENGIVHGVNPNGVHYMVYGRGSTAASADCVSLVAGGDQIGTDQVLSLAKGYAKAAGEKGYDFSPFYQEINPFINGYDLRFVTQETVVAGTEDFDYAGYPSFNTPEAAIEATVEAGFNVVNIGTNHTLDYDVKGAAHSLEEWAKYPEVATVGSYTSDEDRSTVRLIERNGITFAFLAYCYGDNYYDQDVPNDYQLCLFDKKKIKQEISNAQQVADVVITYMHWGEEYHTGITEQQDDLAQYLADLDVDLVLGSHAHILQPVKYYTSESGKKVPVVFGLSDLISGWSQPEYILSAFFSCDFVRVDSEGNPLPYKTDEDFPEKDLNFLEKLIGADPTSDEEIAYKEALKDSKVVLENLVFTPTIEWQNGGDTYVRLLKDMDRKTTNANKRTEGVKDEYTYLRDFVNDLGVEITVAM